MSGQTDVSGRCVLTDLFPDQCGCKHHRDIALPIEPESFNIITATVIALFDGTCALNRSHEIRPGEKIAKAEGVGWICMDCATDLR